MDTWSRYRVPSEERFRNTGRMLLDKRYNVLAPIKAGGMGCVYRAHDTRLDTVVAEKKMVPAAMDPQALKYAQERFREEAMSCFTQVLSILDYLHTRNSPVIYRDLKHPTSC